MGEPRSLDKAEANGGYLWIENSFVDRILPELSSRATEVYLYLVRKAPQGKKYDPVTKSISMSQIGQVLGCSRETVAKAIDALEACGAIEKIKYPGLANRYRLLKTCQKNLAGGDKKTGQGCQENCTTPVEKTSQGDAASQRGTRTVRSPKSIKISLRDSKKPGVQKRKATHPQPRPVQQPSGCGPRKV